MCCMCETILRTLFCNIPEKHFYLFEHNQSLRCHLIDLFDALRHYRSLKKYYRIFKVIMVETTLFL